MASAAGLSAALVDLIRDVCVRPGIVGLSDNNAMVGQEDRVLLLDIAQEEAEWVLRGANRDDRRARTWFLIVFLKPN